MNKHLLLFVIYVLSVCSAFSQSLISISPSSASLGETLIVTMTGQNTNFAQGTVTTDVWLMQGSSTVISPNFVVASGNTTLLAEFTFCNNELGVYDVLAFNSLDGGMILPSGFTVNSGQNLSALTLVSPNTASQGQMLSVNITGQNTSFGQGTSTVWLSQGTETIVANSVIDNSTTNLDSDFSIPSNATVGLWDVNVFAGGCTQSITLIDGFTIIEQVGCTMTVTTSSTNESTIGLNDGTASAIGIGGTPPYTYFWSNGQSTAVATGLAPGNYSVVAVDATGCSATGNVSILQGACSVQLSISVTNETSVGANDGTLTANAINGNPSYGYLWSNGEMTETITGLAPGVYNCYVTDAYGCTTGSTGVVQAFACSLNGSISSTDESAASASDGTAIITAAGGTPPYNYSWSNFQTSSSISGLSPGIYDVTITDASGCVYITSAVVNVGGLACNLSVGVSGNAESQAGANDGMATASSSGGTGTVSFQWDNIQTTSSITGLAPGDYTVVATDSVGCMATATYTVAAGLIIGVYEQPKPELSILVYPNPATDFINVEISGTNQGTLYIYNVSGQLVKESSLSASLSTLNTDRLDNGIYFYRFVSKETGELGSGNFVIQF